MLKYILSFIKKYKSQILLSCVITENIISNNTIVKGTINILYISYLYKENLLYDIINDTRKIIIDLKIYILSFIQNKKFQLKDALFYNDLKNHYDVYSFFKYNKVVSLNDNLLDNIIIYNNIPIYYSDNIRLKLVFIYDNREYILYHTYNNNDIPYPPYTEEIINKYRSDIILPYYPVRNKKKSLYSLFSISSKDISHVKVNNIVSDSMKDYLLSIQTPFNDFGILYNMPVKLEWIISENNITQFNHLYVSFVNCYFDEDNMELQDHEIYMTKEDLKKNIASTIMNDFIEKF